MKVTAHRDEHMEFEAVKQQIVFSQFETLKSQPPLTLPELLYELAELLTSSASR
jgi:hypothetical protein